VHRLVNLKKPVLFIPNLAIHLETDRETFTMNKEDHLKPILATAATDALNNPTTAVATTTDSVPFTCCVYFYSPCFIQATSAKSTVTGFESDHHASFLKLIAGSAGCQVNEIVDMDMYLLDTQPAVCHV
jgi:aspartyl aminopeptidase